HGAARLRRTGPPLRAAGHAVVAGDRSGASADDGHATRRPARRAACRLDRMTRPVAALAVRTRPMPITDEFRDALLQVHGLRFSRNDVPVFGPLDFSVAAGEALLVQGGNGVGKTTLLRVLAGLLRADDGRIVFADGHPAPAYLGHLPAFKADLSTLENLAFLCGLHGRRGTHPLEEALAIVGLAGDDDALSRQLSAGQKKRLSR